MTDMPDVIYADAPVSSLHDGEWRATPDKLATKYYRADKCILIEPLSLHDLSAETIQEEEDRD